MDNNEIEKTILEDFKIINNVDEKQEKIASLYIKKAIQTVLNLTNRNKFPKELMYVVLDMANDFYKVYFFGSNNDENSNNNNIVKSISEDDRKVDFVNASELYISSLLSSHIQDMLSTREKEINRYKLLYKNSVGVDDE